MARAENVNRLAQGMGVDSTATPGMLSGGPSIPGVRRCHRLRSSRQRAGADVANTQYWQPAQSTDERVPVSCAGPDFRAPPIRRTPRCNSSEATRTMPRASVRQQANAQARSLL